MIYKTLLALTLLFTSLQAEIIETFYGPLDITEPLLLDIIKSAPMQRLKDVHQYGVAYYTTHTEEYNRYDHSLGVFAILRKNGAPLNEQAAGLLHDISHTVFSHVGDWIFGKEHQEEDYQNAIFNDYLIETGLASIIEKHGLTLSDVQPKSPMLEQKLPDLCADRIDYNIQGAFFQGFITKEEALALHNDLYFKEGTWMGTNQELLTKLTRFSFFMTKDCWGSARNHFASRFLADALIRGTSTGLISWQQIHTGTDDAVWQLLQTSKDTYIQEKMYQIAHTKDFFQIVAPEKAAYFLKFKCRGIDPLLPEGRLSSLDQTVAEELRALQKQAFEGWSVVDSNNRPPRCQRGALTN